MIQGKGTQGKEFFAFVFKKVIVPRMVDSHVRKKSAACGCAGAGRVSKYRQ